MNQREQGRQRGRAAAAQVGATILKNMPAEFRRAKVLFPSIIDLDLAAAVRDYDRERLACTPDYTQFPEMRGLGDGHEGEREGFREASGLDETAAAFHYSWGHFLYRRINARHVPYWERVGPDVQCTNVFFPHGAEGVTISDNRDIDARGAWGIPQWRPGLLRKDQPIYWGQGGASSAIVMDEEPKCCFPCKPIEIMPPECLADVNAMMAFMSRYREFWGPGNQIWVDPKLRAVAVEKTNCRVAYRQPTANGAICITACTYLDPGLSAFKQQCLAKVMQAKGENQSNSTDWLFDAGAQLRYRRLVDLSNAEANRPGGATLWGALAVVADEAVPFPARICLSGQKTFPEREEGANWSVTQHAGVITGPRRRWLYRAIQDVDAAYPGSITRYKPKLALGEGVAMDPAWQADLDAGRCELAEPVAAAAR